MIAFIELNVSPFSSGSTNEHQDSVLDNTTNYYIFKHETTMAPGTTQPTTII